MTDISNPRKGIIRNIVPTGTVHFVLARPPLENEEVLEMSDQANLEPSEKAAGEENLATNLNTLDQDKALSSKDQEMDAKRQRLKKEEASSTSMDTTENNLEKIRADVDLAEDKPTTTTVCNPGRQDSCKEFTRSPHPILKAQTEPEFEGELFLSIHFGNFFIFWFQNIIEFLL